MEIWRFAGMHGYAVVSKDTDFRERSFAEGHPPKVVWLAVGNLGTAKVVDLLRHEREVIAEFLSARDEALLVISLDVTTL